METSRGNITIVNIIGKPLSRRTMLKWFGASLSLPFLDAMTPFSAMASASTSQAATRMVFIGVEGGIWTGEDGFFPWKEGIDGERALQWGRKGILPGGAIADVGSGFKMTQTLKPLESFRKNLLLLSGLHHSNDHIPNSIVNAHGQDLGTLLTGINISGTPGVALQNGISFDQAVAARIGERTRVASLQLAAGQSSYNTREATGLGYMGFLSYDTDGYAMPVEGEAVDLFDRLFTDGTAEQQVQRKMQRRHNRSILDAVLDESKRIERKVDAADRRRLDEYFSTIRDLERRIERAKAWEGIPVKLPAGTRRPEKAKGNGWTADGSGRIGQMRLMLDMLALALQTDVTRIVTMRLGGYFGSFKFLGFPEDAHGVYAHNEGAPEKVKGARAIDRMHIEQFAYLLSKLHGVEEEGGTLLDNSMVFYGAGLTNGPKLNKWSKKVHHEAHGQINTPVLLAGGGGGSLKTGRHLNYDHGTPLSNLYTSMAEIMGLEGSKFADSTGPLSGLV